MTEHELPAPELAQPKKLVRLGAGVGTAALLALGLLFGSGFFVAESSVSRVDNISNGTADQLLQNFSRARGSLLPAAPDLDPQEWASTLRISRAERAQAAIDIASGNRKAGRLLVWDNLDPDGDVVSITAGGVTQIVPITNAPVEVSIVVLPGEPVLVTGLYDGGGGVTVSVQLSTGTLPLPLMAVGQTVSLPVL